MENEVIKQDQNPLKVNSLLWVFICLLIAIIALLSTIIILNNISSDRKDLSEEVLSSNADEDNQKVYELVNGSEEDVENLIESLNSSLEDDNLSVDEKVKAYYYLGFTYHQEGNLDQALVEYRRALSVDGISDSDKYTLFMAMSDIYDDLDDIPARIEMLEEILKLPDDMKLSYSDWGSVKPLIEGELMELKNEIEE